jgi:hypothetical protein
MLPMSMTSVVLMTSKINSIDAGIQKTKVLMTLILDNFDDVDNNRQFAG